MGIMNLFGDQIASLALQHLDPLEKGLIDLVDSIEHTEGERPCFMLMSHENKQGKKVALAIPCTVDIETDVVKQTTLFLNGQPTKAFELKTVFKNVISNGF